MAKYYGMIGYGITEEAAPGVWEENIIEHPHYGDVLRRSRRYSESNESINDNVFVNNEISILVDPFAMEHSQHMKYITYLGAKWTITGIEIEYPRMTLYLGGPYNENSN